MIEGTVCSGTGGASRAFLRHDSRRIRQLQPLFGWAPYPGTLNVRVTDLVGSVRLLREPVLLTEHETPIGPLRWWPVRIQVGLPWLARPCLDGYVVRGLKSRAPYLEVVAPQSLRSLGATDGMTVRLERIGPWSLGAQNASGATSER